MKQVLEDAKARNKGETDKNGEPKLNSQDAQKLQGLAKLQAENQKNAERLWRRSTSAISKNGPTTCIRTMPRDELRSWAGRVMKQGRNPDCR